MISKNCGFSDKKINYVFCAFYLWKSCEQRAWLWHCSTRKCFVLSFSIPTCNSTFHSIHEMNGCNIVTEDTMWKRVQLAFNAEYFERSKTLRFLTSMIMKNHTHPQWVIQLIIFIASSAILFALWRFKTEKPLRFNFSTMLKIVFSAITVLDMILLCEIVWTSRCIFSWKDFHW